MLKLNFLKKESLDKEKVSQALPKETVVYNNTEDPRVSNILMRMTELETQMIRFGSYLTELQELLTFKDKHTQKRKLNTIGSSIKRSLR